MVVQRACQRLSLQFSGSPHDGGSIPALTRPVVESGASAHWRTGLLPRSLAEVIGQSQVLGPDAPVEPWVLDSGSLGSLILWGRLRRARPTIGRFLRRDRPAILSRSRDIQRRAEATQSLWNAAKIRLETARHLFCSSRDQSFQISLRSKRVLPHMEDGTILLVGGHDWRNPSLELNACLY